MHGVELRPTRCAICQATGDAVEMYPANLDGAAFDPAVFSARRLPDRLHYRIVRCARCGLVRSDPVADPEVLAGLYARSTFDYGEEVANLQGTYGRYLAKLDVYGVKKANLLEIGCGNGFFLEMARQQGYHTVKGVEPSADAVGRADASLREHIVCDLMRPGLFPPDSFDAICMFQVFDHVPDPSALLDECRRLLRPGGLILCLNHNVDALSARVLRSRSPVIDVEHTYLYSPSTLRRLFAMRGFVVVRTGIVFNTYTLRYLFRLLPLPRGLKGPALRFLRRSVTGRLRLRVPLGNMYLIARKPEEM